MKRYILILLMVFAYISSSGLKAQAKDVILEVVEPKSGWVTNSFFDNMFISLGGGAQIYNAEHSSSVQFKHRVVPYVSFDLGKWVAPGWGFRLKIGGYEFVDFANQRRLKYVACTKIDGLYEQKWYYYNFQGNFLVDLLSVFGTYNPKRVYALIPFVGVGYAYGENRNYALTGSAGLINKFKVSRSVDVNLEAQYLLLPDKFNGITQGLGVDQGISLSLGLTYNFRERGFRYTDGLCPLEFQLINIEANELRQNLEMTRLENKTLSDSLDQARMTHSQVKKIYKVTGFIPFSTVLFSVNESEINKDQLLYLKTVADLINANADNKYTIVGYADKETGTSVYNMKLSEKRARVVAKYLVEKFGVNENQLEIKWKGSDYQPFSRDNWNRVVIVEISGAEI